ncbi:hypothetical protein LBMAG25_12050 [Bacteroidota bacterium]|nr:hypothetical protein LBMAG25_12050 [Bacteroidota bacterium]
MLKKILTWLLVVIVLLISGLYVTIVMRQNRTFKAPTPDIKASTDSAIIERGKYLAYGPAHCADCQAPVGKEEARYDGYFNGLW